jgi:hypothetical protein
MERAAIKYWSPIRAKYAKAAEEIATVPAVPPSKLSKKFIELQIPTIHTTVIIESKIEDPVGFPILFVIIRMLAVNTPAKVCAINLGKGGKFLMSSHKPMSPSNNAGPSTEVASQKVLEVNCEKREAE